MQQPGRGVALFHAVAHALVRAVVQPSSLFIHKPGTLRLKLPQTCTLNWPDEAACAASAAALAAALRSAFSSPAALHDAYIELHGPLGAGKTTFVRYLLHALGVQGRVKSPTYAVLEEYEVPWPGIGKALPIRHFDFYRFDDPQEWEDAGFRDVFATPGLKLAEWPEKAEGLLPLPDLRIVIEPDVDEQRAAQMTAHTTLGVALLG
jgi:tRNA threonylcarbamoyladenosine biosynthesis protein TsaE